MNELKIVINVFDNDDDENPFRRDVGVSLVVANDAPIQRVANQLVDAVKATLIAMSYSEQNVAELFDGVYFDEVI